MGETISEAIGADHASFDEYADYLKTATDDAEKVRWRNQLTWTIARHALSEELTLYPAMEKHLGDEGVRLTKTDKEQHQAVGHTFDNFLVLQVLTPAPGQEHFV
jgi:hemerythrin superfamily protein